jgi:MFS family permease
LLVLIAFVVWERRAQWPLIPVHLFANRSFAGAIAANALVGAALIVAMVDAPIVVALLVDPERISATSAAILAPFTVMMALLSFGGGALSSRYGQRRVAAIGILFVLLGYVALWVGLRNDHYTGMVPGLLLAGLGFGLVIAPIGAAALDAAGDSDRGAAAGLTIVARLLGMTLGISVLTAIGVRRLQHLTSQIAPLRQGQDETTAEFLLRQAAFITDVAIPLSIRVVRETFLLAALVALLALIPIRMMATGNRGR